MEAICFVARINALIIAEIKAKVPNLKFKKETSALERS